MTDLLARHATRAALIHSPQDFPATSVYTADESFVDWKLSDLNKLDLLPEKHCCKCNKAC